MIIRLPLVDNGIEPARNAFSLDLSGSILNKHLGTLHQVITPGNPLCGDYVACVATLQELDALFGKLNQRIVLQLGDFLQLRP